MNISIKSLNINQVNNVDNCFRSSECFSSCLLLQHKDSFAWTSSSFRFFNISAEWSSIVQSYSQFCEVELYISNDMLEGAI